MSNLDSQVATSFSPISEPPDIKNWFSSYTYQSPVLDTNELVGDSQRIDELKRGFCVEDSENEEEDNWVDLRKTRNCKSTKETGVLVNPPAVEVPVYSDSLSLPSEPPDIRNWFSSYVYESPELDSAEFNVTSKYDIGHIGDIDKGREGKLKALPAANVFEPVFCKEKISNSCATENNKNHSAGQGKDDLENDLFSTKNLCAERTSCQSTGGAALSSSSVIRDKSDECPRTEAEDEAEDPPTITEDRQQASREDHLTSSPKTEKKSVVHENDSGWIMPNHKSREIKSKCTNNGYTLLKKKSSLNVNDENSSEELGPRKCNDYGNLSSVLCTSKGEDGMLRREALKEKTNLQHTYVVEVAGKWKCPQRSKPNTGPPLKQLRLEKWVHKNMKTYNHMNRWNL